MLKIKVEKWTSDNGNVAISLPQQLGQRQTDIFLQASPAAVNAALLLTESWTNTIGKTITFPEDATYKERHDVVFHRRHNFYERAVRRYTALFIALGLGE